MTEEIFNTVNKIFPELLNLLKKRNPELVTLYMQRYEYTGEQYPPAMRLHNAYQILRAYVAIIEGERE
jgi:hypothetical protein